MSSAADAPLLVFLADDLTGASDVLSQAHRYGLSAALVLDPDDPLPGDVDVVGVAMTLRSRSGDDLDAGIRAGLAPLRATGAEVLLYKVCSTFDSSPTVGSIGRAIELMRETWPDHGPVPVVPAQPDFGRYTAFSQHFGRHSGPDGAQVHRLDRHPVMAHHPSTPMAEADLRRVLGAQLSGADDVGAVHLPAHHDGSFARHFDAARDGGGPAFVVDAVADDDMDRTATALRVDPAVPSLVVGSGGIVAALARTGGSSSPRGPEGSSASGPVLVVSASASVVTAGQIDDAVDHGAVSVEVPVDPDPDEAWVEAVLDGLRGGHDVVAHTARGPEDPRLRTDRPVPADEVGARLGTAVTRAVADGLTHDVMIFGGDTSGHVLTALRVRELRAVEQFVPVAPICRTDDDADVAGCRLVLKGGQAGPPDVVARFARGGTP